MSYNMQKLMNQILQPNPLSNHKNVALIDYLRSFSLTGLQTLEKLQNDFTQKISIKKKAHQHSNMYPQIKIMLQAYQVFILEIYDSCVFVEMEVLGKVFMKMFGQMIKIVKLVVKQQQGFLKNNKDQISNIVQFNTFNIKKQPSFRNFQQNNHKVMQQLQQKHKKQSNQSKSQNIKDHDNNNDSKLNEYWQDYMLMSDIKQHTYKQLKMIDSQLKIITTQFNIQQQELTQTRQDFDKIQKMVNNRQSSTLQTLLCDKSKSKSEQILSQIIYVMQRKGQKIQKFAQLRRKNCNQNQVIQKETNQSYNHFCQEMRQQFIIKIEEVKCKVFSMFKEKFIQFQYEKKLKMPSFSCQAIEDDIIKQTKYQEEIYRLNKFKHKLLAEKLKAQLKLLQGKYQLQSQLKQNLKKLLEQKTITYEQQNLKLRNQIFSYQSKKKRNRRSKNNSEIQNNNQQNYCDESFNGRRIIEEDSSNQETYNQFNADRYKISLKNVRKNKNLLLSSSGFLNKRFVKYDENGKKIKSVQAAAAQNNQFKGLQICSRIIDICIEQSINYQQQHKQSSSSLKSGHENQLLLHKSSSSPQSKELHRKFIFIKQPSHQAQLDYNCYSICKKKQIDGVTLLFIDNFTQTDTDHNNNSNKLNHSKINSQNDLKQYRLNGKFKEFNSHNKDDIRQRLLKHQYSNKENAKMHKQLRNKNKPLFRSNHQDYSYSKKSKRKIYYIYTDTNQNQYQNEKKIKNQSLCQKVLKQVEENDKNNPHHKLMKNKFLRKTAYMSSLKKLDAQNHTGQIDFNREKIYGTSDIKNQFISLNFYKQN